MTARVGRRGMLELAVFGVGGLLLSEAASNKAAAAGINARTASFPRQAWAHRDRVVDLRLPADIQSTHNALDYLLVQEAFGRYGIAYDEGRGDVLRQLFTDDATLHLARGQATPFAETWGADAIVKNFSDAFAFQSDQRRHCFSNVVIERLTKTQATAIAYGIVTVAADGLKLGATVIYTADLRRSVRSHWRFSRMFIGMDDYAGPAPPITESK